MRFFIIFFILICSLPVFSKTLLQEKYSQGLLTDDYGLLSEADFLYETKRAIVTPYQIEDGASVYQRWQCFETKKIKFLYNIWRDSDPSVLSDVIVTLCDYSFEVKDDVGVQHVYVSRRVKQIEDCRELFREWKKVRTNTKYTCLLGEPGSYKNKEKGWIWGKTKTKNGCMSYFVGECESEKKLKEYE